MPLFRNFDKQILYIHIPKTGGTSIENLFNYKLNFSKYHLPRYLTEHQLQHLSLDYIYRYDLLDLEEIDFIFTIVRNPYTRIISEYYWSQYNKKMTFTKFLIYVKRILCTNNTSDDDYIHYTKQSKFIKSSTSIPIKIFKFEQFDKIYEYLKKLFPNLKYRHNYKTNVTNSLSKMSIDDLSYEDISLINELYEDDFHRFGYKMIQ